MSGIVNSAEYRMRTAALEQSLSAVSRLSSRLKTLLEPTEELLNGLCREGDRLPDYFKAAAELTGQCGFEKAWKISVFNSSLYLRESDRHLIAEVGEIIGKSDAEAQTERLRLLIERLQSEIAASRAETAEKSRLCLTLWGLAGAGAATMLL